MTYRLLQRSLPNTKLKATPGTPTAPGLADASGTTIVYRLNAGRLRAYVMRQFGAAVIRPFTSESATTGAGAGTPED